MFQFFIIADVEWMILILSSDIIADVEWMSVIFMILSSDILILSDDILDASTCICQRRYNRLRLRQILLSGISYAGVRRGIANC